MGLIFCYSSLESVVLRAVTRVVQSLTRQSIYICCGPNCFSLGTNLAELTGILVGLNLISLLLSEQQELVSLISLYDPRYWLRERTMKAGQTIFYLIYLASVIDAKNNRACLLPVLIGGFGRDDKNYLDSAW